MKKHFIILIMLFSCGPWLTTQAQENDLLQQLIEEEQQTVEAIALYPEKERHAILEAASHPEVLARMQAIQNRTQESFREIMIELPEADQKKLYDLVRYPELLKAATADGKRKSDKETGYISEGYAEEVQEKLQWANKEYFSTLAVISNLYQGSEQSFEALLQGYSEQTRQAYNELVKLPEVVQTLTENMQTTVLLGDIYSRNAEQVQSKLDSLNVVVAEQKSKELNEWKQSLEDNPEAMAEYEQAAREYAKEQGYDASTYEEPLPEKHTTNIYVHYVWRPYPYWFGWPYWYSYNYWYPYPWWYHWGYYYGPGRAIIFVGLPSYTFMHWHFHHYRHFYHYPHFTDHVIRYTVHQPRAHNSATWAVSNWQRETKNELPRNFITEDKNRVERIRELGGFKMAYESARQDRPDQLTEREFLQQNIDKYPTLKPVLKEMPDQVRLDTRKTQITPRAEKAQSQRGQVEKRDEKAIQRQQQDQA